MAREGTPGYIVEQEGLTGYVKWFSAEKGYGFIAIDDGQGDAFLHRNHATFDPAQGDKVKFSLAEDRRRKRVYAVEVELA